MMAMAMAMAMVMVMGKRQAAKRGAWSMKRSRWSVRQGLQ
jgi:hypothetical protein